jgi:hypothetical protein
MSDKADDMSGDARFQGERAAAKSARRAALGEDNMPSASEIGDAVAKALARVASAPGSTQKLGEIVRCSVRSGYEDVRQYVGGQERIVTKPKAITFRPDETADGREWTLEHGKPVRLKRDAFISRRDLGHVLIAE